MQQDWLQLCSSSMVSTPRRAAPLLLVALLALVAGPVRAGGAVEAGEALAAAAGGAVVSCPSPLL